MKIIDLLNKIANGEEVPKKIKWENIIYAYSEYDKDYLEYPFSDEEYKGLFDMRNNILTQFLKDEVEIIEEPKKIEKLPYYSLKKIQKSKSKDEWYENRLELLEKRINDYHNKINELVDEINNLKEND